MQYKDYITDFSNRTKKVLEKFSECDESNELNVTILLSIATSAFVIPFERLNKEHPSMDQKKFKDIAEKVDDELKKIINQSMLFQGESWSLLADTKKNSLSEDNFNNKLFKTIKENPVQEIISILRNALAHGNINTEVSGNTIETLYFISKKYKKSEIYNEKLYKFIKKESSFENKNVEKFLRHMQTCKENQLSYKIIQCSVEDFKSFLLKWIELLSKSEEKGQNQ